MKTLIYGAGPIGQWLALRLSQSGADVTLLARGRTFDELLCNGIRIVDGLTGERLRAAPKLTQRLGPDDCYELVVVAMQRRSRLEVCPVLAANPNLRNILFLGNDVEGFRSYLQHLSPKQVLLGFPGAGGGLRNGELVVMDREASTGAFGELFIGELDGIKRRRTWEIGKLFEAAGIKVSIERDMDGWLKYHFAFMAPTAAAILAKGGDTSAVARDRELIHRYCRACREAGDALAKVGYRRRQPGIFNLYYWLPRFLEPRVFAKLFGAPATAVRFGLHARSVGPELFELADEFRLMARLAGARTPTLDGMLASIRDAETAAAQKEVA
jgi:2-dehydropantoate 2-reductase